MLTLWIYNKSIHMRVNAAIISIYYSAFPYNNIYCLVFDTKTLPFLA